MFDEGPSLIRRRTNAPQIHRAQYQTNTPSSDYDCQLLFSFKNGDNQLLDNILQAHANTIPLKDLLIAHVIYSVYEWSYGVFSILRHLPSQNLTTLLPIPDIIHLLFPDSTDIRRSYQHNKILYEKLIDNRIYAPQLKTLFTALEDENVTCQARQQFLDDILTRPEHLPTMVDYFIALKNQNISYQNYSELYQMFINHAHLSRKSLDSMARFFVALVRADISYQQSKTLYLHVSKTSTLEKERLYSVLDLLAHLNIKYKHHAEHFNINLLIHNNKLTIHVLDTLKQTGYSYDVHTEIFNIIFTHLSKPLPHYQALIKNLQQLTDYAKMHTLLSIEEPHFNEQIQLLSEMVKESTKTQWDSLPFGPLNKSEMTLYIENLLQQITHIDIQTIQAHKLFTFEAPYYLLTLPNQDTINLSIILRNANLSQLTLDEALIHKIGEIITVLRGPCKQSSSTFVQLLPDAQRIAIHLYKTHLYRNINRFFRCEAFDESLKRKLHVNPDKEMLLCFLLGCLLNDAANKLNWLPDHKLPAKQYLNKIAAYYVARKEIAQLADCLNDLSEFKALLGKALNDNVIDQNEYDFLNQIEHEFVLSLYIPRILDRAELISEETIQSRIANPWQLPALTSFSVHKDGSPYFHKKGAKRTILENAPHSHVIGKEEGEIFIPQGEPIVTMQSAEYLISKIYRSPQLEPKNHYWSELALAHAVEHYLSQKYSEEDCVVVLNGKEIFRPNHNAPHTYRVMLATELIMHYFANFACEPEFKAFCQSVNNHELEWIRVAAAFRVTGRESEASAISNLQQYDRYKIASAQHLRAFIDKTKGNENQILKERICEIVRYIGNPHYEKSINQHLDLNERQLRNFYYRILTVVHNLDLPRCYSANEFEDAMKPCYQFSIESTAQQEALSEIVIYMISLIKAHGGRLSCDINPVTQKLEDTYRGYQEIFAETSLSMKRLFEVTKTVPKPHINEKSSAKGLSKTF